MAKTLAARVGIVEQAIHGIKTDIAIIRSNYVTKEDLQRALLEMTWRIFGLMFATASLLTGTVYYIARHTA